MGGATTRRRGRLWRGEAVLARRSKNAFPSRLWRLRTPSTAHLPDAEHSIDHWHGAAKSPDARRTIMTLTGHGKWKEFEHVYLLLRWQPPLLSFVRCRSIGSFTISHNPAGLLTWKSALWQHKVGGFVWRPNG